MNAAVSEKGRIAIFKPLRAWLGRSSRMRRRPENSTSSLSVPVGLCQPAHSTQ